MSSPLDPEQSPEPSGREKSFLFQAIGASTGRCSSGEGVSNASDVPTVSPTYDESIGGITRAAVQEGIEAVERESARPTPTFFSYQDQQDIEIALQQLLPPPT